MHSKVHYERRETKSEHANVLLRQKHTQRKKTNICSKFILSPGRHVAAREKQSKRLKTQRSASPIESMCRIDASDSLHRASTSYWSTIISNTTTVATVSEGQLRVTQVSQQQRTAYIKKAPQAGKITKCYPLRLTSWTLLGCPLYCIVSINAFFPRKNFASTIHSSISWREVRTDAKNQCRSWVVLASQTA